MRKRAVKLGLLHTWTASLFLLAMPSASASTQKIAADLYAYISENDASSNSTFLVSDAGILVVDTGLDEREGRKLLAEIRKVSSAPVRWIVNTHYHPDHRGANEVVGPGAVVISTAYTRARAGGNAPGYLLGETLGAQGRLALFVGGHEVRIYHPGPAHTMGDVIVYFSDQQTIATGDLFLTNSCPAMDAGDMENWIRALDEMLAMPLEHVVPGHFELGSKAELQSFRNYLEALREQVARLRAGGKTLEQAQRALNMSAYQGFRQFPQYRATFQDNAAAYYRQLDKRARDQ